MFQCEVLVVDDEPAILQLLEEVLVVAGFRTRTAFDAEDALVAVANHRPDVVLTDICLPRMSGLELGHRLRSGTPSIPTILMSAIAHPSRVGDFVFIAKPLDIPYLICKVSEYAVTKPRADSEMIAGSTNETTFPASQ